MEHLQYPIGRFAYTETPTNEEVQKAIDQIKNFPKELSVSLKHCGLEELDKMYRPNSWTAAQVIHHLVDSHINAYVRLKFALLEDDFTAKLYDENAWVKTPENTTINALSSAEFLKHLHFRWTELLGELSPEQWARTFYNPFSKRHLTLQQHTLLYAWHSSHHLTHIQIALKK